MNQMMLKSILENLDQWFTKGLDKYVQIPKNVFIVQRKDTLEFMQSLVSLDIVYEICLKKETVSALT